jgi:FkbM family methyltransferase
MNFVRTLVEGASRNRTLKRHLPSDFGRNPFLVSPDSALGYWKFGIENDLFDFAREFVTPGSVVWDVGANIGLFTLTAAHRAGPSGKVISLEADPWLADLLNQSVAMQPTSSAPVQVISAAASDENGIATFCIAKRGRSSNYLADAGGNSQSGGIRRSCSVITVTLDWVMEHCSLPPRVIKIDVEGAELSVLKGSRGVFAEFHPVILCEVTHNQETVTKLLLDLGYRLFNWDSPAREKVGTACYNTLALPEG